MLNKSWIKIVENIDKRVSRIKTRKRRQASDSYSPHRRVKKKMGCNHYVFQAEGDFCESGEDNMAARKVSFDTDSGDLRVDNHASRCISSFIDDFIDVPKPIDQTIQGIGG